VDVGRCPLLTQMRHFVTKAESPLLRANRGDFESLVEPQKARQ
jgi:hypothetical protein